MRISELTLSDHTVKARDVHMGINKEKILIILYTSKTHSKANRPQKIKIISNRSEKTGSYATRHFCPFRFLNEYIVQRGSIDEETEPFFVFRDKTPVKPEDARILLRNILTRLGLDPNLYGMHSLRAGRTSDLVNFGYSISEVRRMGRWRSNAVFRYIRQ